MHPDDAALRGIASGATVRVFNDCGSYACKAEVSTAGPGPAWSMAWGVWWRKFGLRGTNVNQSTSQRLTDIGSALTFYDCLVEVSAMAPATR